ncbi:MAG: DoxX family protein [Prosthecobacter sp.]|uniref:DoxX family protein n=1 Tax=Prosthecobacter sp. TaxID=1965333 RepID=UPI0025D1B397|nr:DoxX family protein [Prosthecobacter sp.]MCF7786164.1 DoxX family protein [Prosthecobacter sp.]
MLKLLKLSFLPKSPDYGLLILRVALGFSMLMLHGRGKLLNFSTMAEKFAILPGIPGNVNLGLAIFAEVVCSALLIAGLFTRFAALMLAITMGTAFFFFHKSALVDVAASGIKSGELAMVYLIAYVTLLFTGAGKYSVDRE